VVFVLFRMTTLVRESERARAEERLARAEAETAQRLLAGQNDRLRELSRVKDEFVSLVSHELRTPLTSITGYTELLLEEEEADVEERRRFVGVIRRNASRLLRLVDDLLFLARFQEGRLRLELDVVLQADPARLGQLCDNLLSNALKLTPGGGCVTVRAWSDGQGGCWRSPIPGSASPRTSSTVSTIASSGLRARPSAGSLAPGSA
jgi:signal transduction histidine kinase